MKLFSHMVLALTLLLAAGTASAQNEEGRLTFAVDPNWPPLEFVDGSGRIVGYAVDYFTAVCRESGLEAKFIKQDWDSIFTDLEAGKYDAVMASVTITPERRQKMDFTIPYYIVRQSLVVPQASSLRAYS